MATVTTSRMTTEEFWKWLQRPENEGRRWELVDGEVEEMPPPGEKHGLLTKWIGALLWQFVAKRGRGRVAGDSGVIMSSDPDTVRGPDVTFLDESKKLEDVNVGFITDTPLLVIEVLSPSDRPGKTNRRVTEYLRRGVPLVWLVDPETHSMTTYRKGREHVTLDETDELTGEDVLPDFRCLVAEFFTLPGTPQS